MKKITFLLLTTLFFSCKPCENKSNYEKQNITMLLNNWHKAAAEANFEAYFNALHEESIFIGTDATENWNKKAFQDFAKPYFDRGKAWNFKTLERNIYFSKDQKTVWFDELLDTQMKICRGSGVLIKEKNHWKIKHYVLSMTVPNENSDEVVKIKAPVEEDLMKKLIKK